jgi:hypothetical protein
MGQTAGFVAGSWIVRQSPSVPYGLVHLVNFGQFKLLARRSNTVQDKAKPSRNNIDSRQKGPELIDGFNHTGHESR